MQLGFIYFMGGRRGRTNMRSSLRPVSEACCLAQRPLLPWRIPTFTYMVATRPPQTALADLPQPRSRYCLQRVCTLVRCEAFAPGASQPRPPERSFEVPPPPLSPPGFSGASLVGVLGKARPI